MTYAGATVQSRLVRTATNDTQIYTTVKIKPSQRHARALTSSFVSCLYFNQVDLHAALYRD